MDLHKMSHLSLSPLMCLCEPAHLLHYPCLQLTQLHPQWLQLLVSDAGRRGSTKNSPAQAHQTSMGYSPLLFVRTYVHLHKHAGVQHSKVEGDVHTSMELYCPFLESTPFFSSQGISVIRILLSPAFQFLLHALNVLLQGVYTHTHRTQAVQHNNRQNLMQAQSKV